MLFRTEVRVQNRGTQRDRFLGEIEAVTPWPAFVATIRPHYPKGAGRGSPRIPVERTLRMYIAQQSLGLSDEGIDDVIYDSQEIPKFVDFDLRRVFVPDAITPFKFRNLLEKNKHTHAIFTSVNDHLAARGLLLREDSVVDAKSSLHPVRPRTRRARATLRCIRRRREINGS